MNDNFKIDEAFLLPLFDELYGVKETDFSIQINPFGKGNHKLLMLSDCKTHAYLPENEFELLNGIIDKGLKKTQDDYWILNIANEKANFEQLLQQLKPQHLIIWGCDDYLNNARINLALHQQALLQGVSVLKAGSLSDYLSDAQAKGKLWLALKKMFFN